MKNREIYVVDPTTRKLANEGVASVNEDQSKEALAVLRFELDTFVCEGEYQKGIHHIMQTYLSNLEREQQPGVWVSGFFGSGKSHLVKMLRAMWVNQVFSDQKTARDLVNLPSDIKADFKELDVQARRLGGLHAAAGTLGAGDSSASVRLALLGIVFKSAGLPEHYHQARFVLWLKKDGHFAAIEAQAEKKGIVLRDEIANLFVAKKLHQLLVDQGLFKSVDDCREALRKQFPREQDVSSDQMVEAIREAISKDGKFPLTLLVLDELLQYIGQSADRSMQVQEAVEACGKKLGSHLIVVATGQTAITSAPNLSRLEGRFTIRVELSDHDVEKVIRQVVLNKKPSAIAAINAVLEKNAGEISSHINNTSIAHKTPDNASLVPDYPVLPSRKRLWEVMLRVMDRTGTMGQLRNQLSLVNKAAQSNVDATLGYVVPADFLYFDTADRLLQARVLPRRLYEETQKWSQGDEDHRLLARACGLIFLVNQISKGANEIGIKATVETLADLMVEDLEKGSAALRQKLEALLEDCRGKQRLIDKIGDEYHIQTEEGSAWNDSFFGNIKNLNSEAHIIDTERIQKLREFFREETRRVQVTQGVAKVSREFSPVFDTELPKEANSKLTVWIRDEWGSTESVVLAEARALGTESPVVTVFIPGRSMDEVRSAIIEAKAADQTLNQKGNPTSADGKQARAVLESLRDQAQRRLKDLLNQSLSDAKVFMGGGEEVGGAAKLADSLQGALQRAMVRLYPEFSAADQLGWEKAYDLAKQGAPDALARVGHSGEVQANPVCRTILSFLGTGKKGRDIEERFEVPPYGWSLDTIDAAVQALHVAGLIKAKDETGKEAPAANMERKQLRKCSYYPENIVLTAGHRIAARGAFQAAGINPQPSREPEQAPGFLDALAKMAESAGGEEPRPQRPNPALLEELRQKSGNDQVVAIATNADQLRHWITEWMATEAEIKKRWPNYELLSDLVVAGQGSKAAAAANDDLQAIRDGRLLLKDPDPVQPVLRTLEQGLRQELKDRLDAYKTEFAGQNAQLDRDGHWGKLAPEGRLKIQEVCGLVDQAPPRLETAYELSSELRHCPLATWDDRRNGLATRFANAREAAAVQLLPKAKPYSVPKRTLETAEDLKGWLEQVKKDLEKGLSDGPVIIQ